MSFEETSTPRDANGKFAPKTGASAEISLGESRPEPLPRLSLNAYNHTTMHYTMPRDGGDMFELETPYQRGSVWNEGQRQALIRSMLMGLPTGSIVLNRRGYHNQKAFAVVDGKQRIEALRAWEDDEFSVPRHWFEDRFLEEPDSSDPDVTYSGLSIIGHRHWGNRPVSTLEANVATLGEEAEIYGLINSAGSAQTDENLANAESFVGDTTFVGDTR